MARPRKNGLDYFSHDCDASDDQRLRRVRKRYGETGIAWYWRLLEMAYAQGRALELGPDDAVDLIADELRTPYVEDGAISWRPATGYELIEYIEYCCKIGLFSQAIYDEFGKVWSDQMDKRMGLVMVTREVKREENEKRKAKKEQENTR